MPLNDNANRTLQSFFHNKEFDGGISFRSALIDARLDFTTRSLKRIDKLLDLIRDTYKLREEKFVTGQGNQNFLYFLAFYVAKVIGKNSGAKVDWYSYQEMCEMDPAHKTFGEAFYSSIMCVFNSRGPRTGEIFAPLHSITSRLFGKDAGKDAGKSVVASADRLLRRLKEAPALGNFWLDTDVAACVAGLPAMERSFVQVRAPQWIGEHDPLNKVVKDFPLLLFKGKTVWAHIVQANTSLFKKGDDCLPAEIIYDPQGLVTPDELAPAAARVFEIKQSFLKLDRKDPQQAPLWELGNRMAQETERALGVEVPSQIYQGRLLLSTALVYRPHLPKGVLSGAYFPVLISDKCAGSTMILPSRWWPPGLAKNWQRI
jgi:hypothetical protein